VSFPSSQIPAGTWRGRQPDIDGAGSNPGYPNLPQPAVIPAAPQSLSPPVVSPAAPIGQTSITIPIGGWDRQQSCQKTAPIRRISRGSRVRPQSLSVIATLARGVPADSGSQVDATLATADCAQIGQIFTWKPAICDNFMTFFYIAPPTAGAVRVRPGP